MFRECQSLETIPDFNFSNVNDANLMFYNCFSLKYVPSINMPLATTSESMFQNCRNILKIDTIDLPLTTNCNSIFYINESLQYIRNFNIPLCTSANQFLFGCKSLIEINSIDLSSLSNGSLDSAVNLQKFGLTSLSKSFTINTIPLSAKAIIEVFNGLDDLTATTYETLTLTNVWGTDDLLSTDIEIATNKNWEVVIDGFSYPATPP